MLKQHSGKSQSQTKGTERVILTVDELACCFCVPVTGQVPRPVGSFIMFEGRTNKNEEFGREEDG